MAKFTVLLALCAYLADERSDDLRYHRFIIGLIMVGVPATLIILQPDLGSASVLDRDGDGRDARGRRQAALHLH